MTYDFFVFPADRAADLEQAESLYETTRETGPTTPGSPLARFMVEVTGVAGLLTEPVAGHDAAAYVCTSWTDPMAQLRSVADVARRHGLSVLDVQLRTLYDPRGSLDVALEVEGGPRLPYLTRPLLRDVVAHVAEGRYPCLGLVRDDRVVTVRTGQPDLDADALWAWATDDVAR